MEDNYHYGETLALACKAINTTVEHLLLLGSQWCFVYFFDLLIRFELGYRREVDKRAISDATYQSVCAATTA